MADKPDAFDVFARRRAARAARIQQALFEAARDDPGFVADPRTVQVVLDELDPAGIEARAVAAAKPTAPLAGHLMRKLRALGLDIRWWACLWASECAWAEMRTKPVPELKTIAARAKLPTRDLEHLGERATLDEAALLLLCVPPVFLKTHGFPITPRVRARAAVLDGKIREADRKLGENRRHLPWEDPLILRGLKEQKR